MMAKESEMRNNTQKANAIEATDSDEDVDRVIDHNKCVKKVSRRVSRQIDELLAASVEQCKTTDSLLVCLEHVLRRYGEHIDEIDAATIRREIKIARKA
jgi:hypothetical protein